MGIFSKGFDANTMVSLTDDGKRAIDKEMIAQVKSYAILSELDQHSPQSLATLSKETQANIFAIKREVERLRRQGLVKILDMRE